MVAGRKLSFINDLAVTQDGKKVYFTSSSSKWERRDYMHLIMEATADGRYDEEQSEAGFCSSMEFQNLFPFFILAACWNTTLRAENCQW